MQWVKEVRLDCDGDTLLVKVDQVGAACHTGDRTCFDADLLPLTPMAEPSKGRRRTFGPVVLLGLAAGGLTAVAGNKPAAEAGTRHGGAATVTYDAHLPLVTALAWWCSPAGASCW